MTWLVAAITGAAVVAFLVPLAFLLRTLAEDRAVAAATARSQTFLAVAAARSPPREPMGCRRPPAS